MVTFPNTSGSMVLPLQSTTTPKHAFGILPLPVSAAQMAQLSIGIRWPTTNSPIAAFSVSLLVPSVWTKVATGWTTTASGGRRELDRRGSPGFRDRGFPDRDRRGPPGGRRGDAPQGHSIRPDQRCRPYLPNVICAACKNAAVIRPPAVTCWQSLCPLSAIRNNCR